MNKIKLSKKLVIAVQNTNNKYDNFQGIVLFGSFANPEVKKPRDVDFIPVLNKYDGCWQFSTDDEGDYDEAYHGFKEMEEFFGTHFPEFAEEYDVLFKTRWKRKALFHVESLVAIDNLPELQSSLVHYRTNPENFIGTKKAAQIISEFYKSLRNPLVPC
ncbi:MAG: hypothetical protein ABIH72_04620 [archaeon]